MRNRPTDGTAPSLAHFDLQLAQMGGLAEALLWQSFIALERRDRRTAEIVADRYRMIDAMERDIQERAVAIFVSRRLAPRELHQVLAVLKIAGELAGIGGLAMSIARQGIPVSIADPPRQLFAGLKHMTQIAARQLKDVLDAYAAHDAEKALCVWRNDADLDSLHNSVFRELLTWMMEDTRNIEQCSRLLIGAKNLERIGDHTTNIAEHIHLLETGRQLGQPRAKRDDTSSISQFDVFQI